VGWWHDIITGLPSGRIVNDSMIDLFEAPGLGLDIDAKAAKPFLKEEDSGFFD
jgi:L-alanine-DL-glutamate epimerase-like enolase superfamily enzyme